MIGYSHVATPKTAICRKMTYEELQRRRMQETNSSTGIDIVAYKDQLWCNVEEEMGDEARRCPAVFKRLDIVDVQIEIFSRML